MSMGRRKQQRQSELWLATQDLPRSPGHPFYERLNHVLAVAGFDQFCEKSCRKFYAEKMGRPSIPPGVYFRMLMIGYFEKIDSEGGIAWRCIAIGGGGRASVRNVCTASVASWWSAASSTCWTTAGCGGRTCGAGRTSRSVT